MSLYITTEERFQIKAMWRDGHGETKTDIALCLGRSRQTIAAEIKRGQTERREAYFAEMRDTADEVQVQNVQDLSADRLRGWSQFSDVPNNTTLQSLLDDVRRPHEKQKESKKSPERSGGLFGAMSRIAGRRPCNVSPNGADQSGRKNVPSTQKTSPCGAEKGSVSCDLRCGGCWICDSISSAPRTSIGEMR